MDDSNRTDYEQRGSKRFVPFDDKPKLSMNYYDVPGDLLDDSEELCRWASKSVAIASAAANKKSKRLAKKELRQRKRPT